MSYYQHRISHEWNVSKKLLDEGYLTIGFRKLTQTNILEAKGCFEKFDEIYKNNFDDTRRNQVYRFINLKAGDTVVVPLYNKQFAIVEVCEDTDIIDNLSDKIKEIVGLTDEIDLGFYVKVKHIINTQRSFVSSRLQSRMKNQMTNVCIDDLADDVEIAKKVEGPVNFQKKIREELSEKMLLCIRELNDRNTEKLVMWYLKKIGATSARVLSKNSSEKVEFEDADVIAEFDAINVVILVQVKAHEGEESDWAVRQIERYIELRTDSESEVIYIPWVISTADNFSEDAINMAVNSKVKLIDGLTFAGMLIDVGIDSINVDLEFD